MGDAITKVKLAYARGGLTQSKRFWGRHGNGSLKISISSPCSELCDFPVGAASLGWDGRQEEDEDGGGDPTTSSWQPRGCKVHCWHRSTAMLWQGESIPRFPWTPVNVGSPVPGVCCLGCG